eukprot:7527771-Lingulodinium_polyedra.AAC.1
MEKKKNNNMKDVGKVMARQAVRTLAAGRVTTQHPSGGLARNQPRIALRPAERGVHTRGIAAASRQEE